MSIISVMITTCFKEKINKSLIFERYLHDLELYSYISLYVGIYKQVIFFIHALRLYECTDPPPSLPVSLFLSTIQFTPTYLKHYQKFT